MTRIVAFSDTPHQARRRSPVVLLAVSALLWGVSSSPSHAEDRPPVAPAPIQDVAVSTWPFLTADQRVMVDLVASDLFENELSEAQRRRIGGGKPTSFDLLPAWRKAPFRGTALRHLGHGVPENPRKAV